MSRPAQPPGNDPKDSEGDLTDEQIRGLLKAAEQHLRASPTSSSSRRTQAMKPFKLQHTNIDKPYIQNVGHVARVDPSRMLDKSQREPAGRSLIPKGPTKLDKVSVVEVQLDMD